MNLSKPKPRKFDPLGIRFPTLCMIGSTMLLALSVLFHDTPYSPLSFTPNKDKLEENQRFMRYLEDHKCLRVKGFLFLPTHYVCDSRVWSESELIRVMNGRYPN